MSVLNMKEFDGNFKKYNWVDVRKSAKYIFWNYRYELAWAEDMWNILMFNSVVDSSLVAPSRLADEDIGDVLLWLVSMYDLFYDYKICIDHESNYKENIGEFFDRVKDWNDYVLVYLNDEIYSNYLKIEFNRDGFETIEEYEDFRQEELYSFRDNSISYEVLISKVSQRRHYIVDKINKYFNNLDEIVRFMSGYHYVDYYYKYEEKESKIHREFLHKIKLIDSKINEAISEELKWEMEDEKRDIEDEYEKKLEELERKLPISLLGLESIGFYDAFFGDSPCVCGWIDEGMYSI